VDVLALCMITFLFFRSVNSTANGNGAYFKLLLGGLGIGVGERCYQSCAQDRKKNDDYAIREEHNRVWLQATTRVA
jgi:hypothetical protein